MILGKRMRETAISIWMVFMVCVLLMGPVSAGADPYIVVQPRRVVQGGILLLEIKDAKENSRVTASFDGVETRLTYDAGAGAFVGLLGVDLEKEPAESVVRIDVDGAVVTDIPVSVVSKDYGERRLTLPPSMTEFDEETLARIRRERKLVDSLWSGSDPHRLWSGAFLKPAPGVETGPFGRRTFVNDEPRNRHSGVDLRAEKNENIFCSNTGRVVLAKDLFFSGKSVFIDHGQGLFTMYFHLNDILVDEGAMVTRGQVIGKAGSTGRSTGVHLHWGVRLDNARVDPTALLEITNGLGGDASSQEQERR